MCGCRTGALQGLRNEKDYAGAADELRLALAAKPKSVEAHYALAEVYQRMGRTDDARREFDQCARLNAQQQAAGGGIAGQHP